MEKFFTTTILFLALLGCSNATLSNQKISNHNSRLKSENTKIEDNLEKQKNTSPCFQMLTSVDLATRCDVFISVKFKDQNNMKPVITGLTNLPDNTILMIFIGKPGIFGTLLRTHVKRGKFKTGKITTLAGTSLSPGSYEIEVVTPLPSLQPNQ